MQPRERLLALGVGLLGGLWLLDLVAIDPGLAWLAAVRKDAAAATRAVAEAKALVDRGPHITATWRGALAAGLSEREDAARLHLQQAITAAARSSGCTLEAVGSGQRVPATKNEHFDVLRTTVTAQGSLSESLAFFAALEAAALPLRIERCELGSRDAHKDALDLGLTISTRIANPPREAPAGTTAWKPEAADGAANEALLATQPFSAERRAQATAHTAAATTVAPTTPVGGWALVGISAPDGTPVAFLRNLGTNEERQGKAGDTIGELTIASLTDDHVVVHQGETEREIAIGTQLDGTALPTETVTPTPAADPAPATTSSSSGRRNGRRSADNNSAGSGGTSTTSAAPAASTPAPPPPSDAERDAILQRLRERRNRTTGTSP